MGEEHLDCNIEKQMLDLTKWNWILKLNAESFIFEIC